MRVLRKHSNSMENYNFLGNVIKQPTTSPHRGNLTTPNKATFWYNLRTSPDCAWDDTLVGETLVQTSLHSFLHMALIPLQD